MTEISASLSIPETGNSITRGSAEWADRFRDRIN